ncbi:SWIM zinc finger family protein [Bifidobacterium scardovii]|uniref:SWIM zinc finger family protein n=1 Tax=Bifidobacterium scardovii TaxID=158787 RepID=UPI00291B8490|nr:SWIM zinc finger family protein [Bifidobacterium scardovii]MDU8982822.1 SWIM zinc finger family protein [Bifidobacterium scardovii]
MDEQLHELDDSYYHLFERRILDRGHAYYDAGKVDPPIMIAENLWHTVVRGTDDYLVDIRLRHGRVVSAACTCPYARRSMYCKHVAAALIAMSEERLRQRRTDESADQSPRFPREALNCVRWYAMKEFPKYQGLTEEDWRAVRRIFETLYCIPDLDKTYMRETMKALHESTDERRANGEARRAQYDDDESDSWSKEKRYCDFRRSKENDYEPRTETLAEQHESRYRAKMKRPSERYASLANMRLMVPFFDATHLDELPHTWMTILEAAYEHLHDREGLRRLYVYYILIAQTDPEAVYVQKLRDLSGEHWQEDRDRIVGLCERNRRGHMGSAPVNPAYERLLREERLSDAAWKYCWINSRDILIRMLDIVAIKPENADLALKVITRVLDNPDSPIFEHDTKQSAERICRWLRKIDSVYGYQQAYDLAGRIVDMFPDRSALREKLADYLPQCEVEDDGDDDGAEDGEVDAIDAADSGNADLDGTDSDGIGETNHE